MDQTATSSAGGIFMTTNNLASEFLLAAQHGNVDALRNCLRQGVDVNTRNRTKQTAIILASLNKHYDCVQILIDAGANADCKPQNILEFGMMGSAYARGVLKLQNPKVGIVNIGAEEGKGNELTKKAYELLKENTIDINFVGNVEARDIPSGDVDVIVCDGFTGNVVLKLTEGVAMTMFSMLKSAFTKNAVTKLGALLSKGGLMDMKKRLDYKEYGGAPFMGVDGCLIKAHGSSDSKAIMNAVRQAIAFNEGNVLENIKSSLRKIREDENDES